MPAGFDVIVDYGEGDQVCKIHVPALMPTDKVMRAAEMKQHMYDFLADLVPDSLRGKELGRGMMISGATISMSVVEYERVIINEVQYANQPFGADNTITVTFKNENCQELTGK